MKSQNKEVYTLQKSMCDKCRALFLRFSMEMCLAQSAHKHVDDNRLYTAFFTLEAILTGLLCLASFRSSIILRQFPRINALCERGLPG